MRDILANRFVRVILMPAAVFQAVLVGPGYGSGREVMEFISQYGAVGGALALPVVVATMFVILAFTFEIGRLFRIYDYRRFFKKLLGRAWVIYEALFIATIILVLAVTTSAAGTILLDAFQIPYMVGAVLVLLGIVVTTYYGRHLVELTLTYGMIAFSAVLISYLAIVAWGQGDRIAEVFRTGTAESGWALNGFRFAVYNCCVVPALLFVAREFETRHEVLIAAAFAAVSGSLPAIVFHFTFPAGFPAVIEEALPTYWMVQHLGMPVFYSVFTIVLFVMMVQTQQDLPPAGRRGSFQGHVI